MHTLHETNITATIITSHPMTDKQVNASFLPSIPNGETVRSLAGLKRLTVVLGVSQLGTPGEYVDIPFSEDNYPSSRVSVLLRAADSNYDGVDNGDRTRYVVLNSI
jgi:hypothetical protein